MRLRVHICMLRSISTRSDGALGGARPNLDRTRARCPTRLLVSALQVVGPRRARIASSPGGGVTARAQRHTERLERENVRRGSAGISSTFPPGERASSVSDPDKPLQTYLESTHPLILTRPCRRPTTPGQTSPSGNARPGRAPSSQLGCRRRVPRTAPAKANGRSPERTAPLQRGQCVLGRATCSGYGRERSDRICPRG
jgi:hypothetical protein